MKRFFKRICLLLAIMVLGLQMSFSTLAAPVTSDATPTTSNIYVNGTSIAFAAYTINGSNYFKLRDVAKAFKGTTKEFAVTWQGGTNTITVALGKTYTAVGGELAPLQGTATVQAAQATSSYMMDSQKAVVMAYVIGGNTFYRLRDLASTMNFGLTFSGTTNTIDINTSVGYDSNDNSKSGGSMAELVGSWSGNFFDGNRGTIYFNWNGTFTQGYGDPSYSDYKQVSDGTFTLSGSTLSWKLGDTTASYTYTVSIRDGLAALECTYGSNTMTLYKH